MCEIAVLDPERANLSIIQQVAGKFHDEQGDGLGVLAVKQTDDETFEYETYCSTQPHWQTLYTFLRRHVDDTWRFVIHGRYATAGAVNREGAHPISVDCDSCEFDYVIHNGSIRNHETKRSELESEGHHFNTKVDSEIIPHEIGRLPEDVDNLTQTSFDFKGNLNYLVFSENGIFVHTARKYDVTDDFLMTCSRRDFDDAEELGFERSKSTRWALVTPGEDGPEVETATGNWQSYRGNARTSHTSSASSGMASANAARRSRSQSGNTGRAHPQSEAAWPSANPEDEPEDDAAEIERYTETYENHAKNYRQDIIAIKVAPDVMKVIEKHTGNEAFVYKNETPRLYYWYAPEDEPDDIGEMERRAELRDKIDPEALEQLEAEDEQAALQDFPSVDDDIENVIVDEVMREVQSSMDEDVMWSAYAEVEDTIRRAVKSGTDALA